ncbi:MAG: LCP family protein [Myxococcales bacterium]|nr:LCP family protein [Myxococcales bacterium]
MKTLSLKLALVLLSLLLVGAGLFAAARYQPLDAAPAVPAITLAPRGQRAALDKLLAAVRHARDPRLSFVTEGVATPPLSRTLNILLAGVDTRPGGWGGRTDALVVLVIDGSSQHVGLISVPRDLLVGIPESDDPRAPRVAGRINTVYLAGIKQSGTKRGVTLLRRVIRQTLGLSIAHVVFVAHAGFEQLVDAMGGVDVYVQCPIKDSFIDPHAPGGRVPLDLAEGLRHVDGRTALMFARSRHGRGIFDRARRQQALLLAMRDRLVGLGLDKVKALLPQLRRTVYSDLDVLTIVRLFRRLSRVQRAHIHGLVLDTRQAEPMILADGRWVMMPKPDAIHARLSQLFALAMPGRRVWKCPPADAGLRWRVGRAERRRKLEQHFKRKRAAAARGGAAAAAATSRPASGTGRARSPAPPAAPARR